MTDSQRKILESHVEVFGKGFSATRTVFWPRVFSKISDGLWVMEDVPTRKVDPRSHEFVSVGLDPAEYRRLADEYSLATARFCDLHPGLARTKDEALLFKQARFRRLGSEPAFVRQITEADLELPEFPVNIFRVNITDQVEAVYKSSGRKLMPKGAELDDSAQMRLFAAWNEDFPVGWVISVRVEPASSWVASLWVDPNFRRKGIGQGLMKTMFADDYSRGIRKSFLLSSSTGALLYPTLGYERIGTLDIYSRAKQNAP